MICAHACVSRGESVNTCAHQAVAHLVGSNALILKGKVQDWVTTADLSYPLTLR